MSPACGVQPEEQMLVDLVQRDSEKNSGLQILSAQHDGGDGFRRRTPRTLISQSELNEYTRWLASAVTEAMHYFIGHCCYSPQNEARYLAVTAAHITHMLRDTVDDIQAGYFNIPREVLDAITSRRRMWTASDRIPRVGDGAGCSWRGRYFKAGREYLNQVENRAAGLQDWHTQHVLNACLT